MLGKWFEEGEELSKGEWQRLAVARARGRIVLLTSHRVSTLQIADWIIMFKEGGIAASGTQAQLWGAGGIYSELFNQPVPGRP